MLRTNVICTNCVNTTLLRTYRTLHKSFEPNLRNGVNLFKVLVESLKANFLQFFKKMHSLLRFSQNFQVKEGLKF